MNTPNPNQRLLPADESFPAQVRHVANLDFILDVVWYGALSTPQGAVPVVATDGTSWYAGEADVTRYGPTLLAVNGYGDELTAKTYALSIFVL